MAFETMQTEPNENGRMVDWLSGNEIRKTDNSAKEEDFYPADQSASPLYLDPLGIPYSQLRELGHNDLGDGDRNV